MAKVNVKKTDDGGAQMEQQEPHAPWRSGEIITLLILGDPVGGLYACETLETYPRDLKERHAAELARLGESHAQELSQLREAHESEFQSITQSHEVALERLQHDAAAEQGEELGIASEAN